MSDAKPHAKPSSKHHHHRKDAVTAVPVAIITVSDTRTLEDDTGGALVADLLQGEGHEVASREIVKDEPGAIRAATESALTAEGVLACPCQPCSLWVPGIDVERVSTQSVVAPYDLCSSLGLFAGCHWLVKTHCSEDLVSYALPGLTEIRS